MTCCNKKSPLDSIYSPISKRLVEFGMEVYDDAVLEKYSNTFLWIFTFYHDDEMCEECQFKFSDMSTWFSKYGMFENPTRNVKWVIEDEPDKNLIYKEIGFSKTPMHIFCDSDGKIIDIVTGFPTPDWLEKHILPLIQGDMNTYA